MAYDFEDIIEDSIVTTNFVITNEGSDTLKITKVSASCGCTAVIPEKNELKLGESTNIKVTFIPKEDQESKARLLLLKQMIPKVPP